MWRSVLLMLAFTFSSVILAEPVAGSKNPQDIDPKKLKAGQFVWNTEGVSSGSVAALVSIPEQRLYLYRNGSLIAISTVSTGKRGYGTPAGVYSVLEKDKNHRSRTYDNAPMPYANRLTWEGVALHAGNIPGYPASHGCIRLPMQFAKQLFDVSTLGMTVVVAGYQGQSKLARPNLQFADLKEEKANLPDLNPEEEFRWQPENATAGALSVVLSEKDQHLFVYRNGLEIGRAKIAMTLTDNNLGTHAFIMQQSEGVETDPILSRHWLKMGSLTSETLNKALFQQLDIPQDVAKALNSILTPETTLVVTNSALLKQKPVTKPAQVRCLRGNCVHGLGTEVYADGSKYIGQFKNGLSEGQGQLIMPNGEKYVGTFKDDRFQWN